MIVKIEDDFDMEKIATCGQCFRYRVFEDGMYRFVTDNYVIYIKKLESNEYFVSCDKNDWKNIWQDYFDLNRNYQAIRNSTKNKIEFVDRAMEAGEGIRVLRQNPWEMLITFIISQRKSIPAITKAVEELSKRYGEERVTEYETLHLFPTVEQLCKASEEELSLCGLGYRTAYVKSAIEMVSSQKLNLKVLDNYDDEMLFSELLKVHGVGKKVANCVSLFGYGRIARVPIDVWISRAIEEEFQGKNPFGDFGETAGIIQQYIFYYEKNQKKSKL